MSNQAMLKGDERDLHREAFGGCVVAGIWAAPEHAARCGELAARQKKNIQIQILLFRGVALGNGFLVVGKIYIGIRAAKQSAV